MVTPTRELPAPSTLETEQDRVERWRVEALRSAGYPVTIAVALALDPLIDLHVACGILEQGCPLDTALEILT